MSKDSVSVKYIIKVLLDDEKLLTDTINNFDYNYLDNTNDKSRRIEEILNNKNDLMIVKINNILEDIKRTEEIIGFS